MLECVRVFSCNVFRCVVLLELYILGKNLGQGLGEWGRNVTINTRPEIRLQVGMQWRAHFCVCVWVVLLCVCFVFFWYFVCVVNGFPTHYQLIQILLFAVLHIQIQCLTFRVCVSRGVSLFVLKVGQNKYYTINLNILVGKNSLSIVINNKSNKFAWHQATQTLAHFACCAQEKYCLWMLSAKHKNCD